MPSKTIWLVPRPVSEDALQAAQELISDILSGRTVGFAIVAMQDAKHYTVDIVGACRDAPTFTRGMILSLSDEIAKLI